MSVIVSTGPHIASFSASRSSDVVDGTTAINASSSSTSGTRTDLAIVGSFSNPLGISGVPVFEFSSFGMRVVLHLCKAETEFFRSKSQLFLEALSDLLVRDPAVLNTRACLSLTRSVLCTLGGQHLRSCIFGGKGGRYTVRYVIWFWF